VEGEEIATSENNFVRVTPEQVAELQEYRKNKYKPWHYSYIKYDAEKIIDGHTECYRKEALLCTKEELDLIEDQGIGLIPCYKGYYDSPETESTNIFVPRESICQLGGANFKVESTFDDLNGMVSIAANLT